MGGTYLGIPEKEGGDGGRGGKEMEQWREERSRLLHGILKKGTVLKLNDLSVP